MTLLTRPASPEDDGFLFYVYAGVRQEEMKSWGWGPEQRQAFLRMQFDARRRGYRATYPTAEESILVNGGTDVGSMIVFRGPAEVRLVDISLLPEHRGRGIGTKLIGELIREAASSGLPLRLSVAHGNPAARLYERLGFVNTGQDDVYAEMQHGSYDRTSQ